MTARSWREVTAASNRELCRWCRRLRCCNWSLKVQRGCASNAFEYASAAGQSLRRMQSLTSQPNAVAPRADTDATMCPSGMGRAACGRGWLGWLIPDGRIGDGGAAMMPSGAPLAPAAAETGCAAPPSIATSRGRSIDWLAGVSMPVATTDTRILPVRVSSIAEPKMMLASSSTSSRMRLAAWSTSNSVRSSPPVMLISRPRAPAMLVSSSSGLLIAASAARTARFSPSASPVPIIALPISAITVRMSAKSRLTSPGAIIRSVTPRTPM